MSKEPEIRKCLNECLTSHEKYGTLEDQTPKSLRKEIASALGVDVTEVDEWKPQIKVWIGEFIASKSSSPKQNSSGTTSSSRSSTQDGSAEELRSLAKLVGVPPRFWQGMDKDDVAELSKRLIQFADDKKMERANEGGLPSKAEAKRYKAKQEAAAELEGINSSNVVSGKRKRTPQFPF